MMGRAKQTRNCLIPDGGGGGGGDVYVFLLLCQRSYIKGFYYIDYLLSFTVDMRSFSSIYKVASGKNCFPTKHTHT